MIPLTNHLVAIEFMMLDYSLNVKVVHFRKSKEFILCGMVDGCVYLQRTIM